MKSQPGISFVIHDLNTWGGQDRSTLEIARRISHRWPTNLISFTLEDPEFPKGWGNARFQQVRPNIRRPVLFKSILFYCFTWLKLRTAGQKTLVHATGACSLLSDVVQVQFVHAAWREERKTLGGRGGTFLQRSYHRFLEHFNLLTEKIAFSRAKTYIAISRAVAQELKQYYGITKNVHVIHHGVDPGSFLPPDPSFAADRAELRSKLGVRTDQVMIILVGSYERKGLGASIEALAKLPKEVRSRAKLVAVGNGDAAHFKKLAEAQGVAADVVLVPATKDIIRYYRSADIFLLPTLYEPFGLVILEALSCGLPSVVSKLAGGSELIRDGQEGALIQNPRNADEIAGLLLPLIQDSQKRNEMASKARLLALGHTWDHVAGEYLKVFETLAHR